jgi:hypothetical protein
LAAADLDLNGNNHDSNRTISLLNDSFEFLDVEAVLLEVVVEGCVELLRNLLCAGENPKVGVVGATYNSVRIFIIESENPIVALDVESS